MDLNYPSRHESNTSLRIITGNFESFKANSLKDFEFLAVCFIIVGRCMIQKFRKNILSNKRVYFFEREPDFLDISVSTAPLKRKVAKLTVFHTSKIY